MVLLCSGSREKRKKKKSEGEGKRVRKYKIKGYFGFFTQNYYLCKILLEI